MAKKSAEFQKDVRRALRNVGKYNKSLEIQIFSLAGSLRALALAIESIDNLDDPETTSTNRYGKEVQIAHPAFKVLKDSQEAVTRQMKALGLTSAELAGGDDNDPLVELTKAVRDSSKQKKVILTPPES